MNKMNPKVDGFLRKSKEWREEFQKLRTIILGCQLAEELKWGWPCYSFNERNIVLIHGFKEYCALLFFKGALLKDSKGILIQQTENVQAARQIRFTNVQQIAKMAAILKAYIEQAIEVERAGLKVNLKKTATFSIPEEFQNRLDECKCHLHLHSQTHFVTIVSHFDSKTFLFRFPGWKPFFLLFIVFITRDKTCRENDPHFGIL